MCSDGSMQGTIIFSVVGRTHFGFDVFSVPIQQPFPPHAHSLTPVETQLTDGISVNFNGSFASDDKLAYISERTGSAKIYIKQESDVPEIGPVKGLIARKGQHHDLFYDRPIVAGGRLYFVSTQDKLDRLRQSWTAVYATSLVSGQTTRLTPPEVSDLSPSLSRSGKWVAVASYEGRGWQGEVEDLHTNIYIFNAEDGTDRRMVAKNGGWPTWADDSTIFFHRRAEDGWWSVFKVCIQDNVTIEAERITPPCVHAFTPAASTTGEWLAVATRRPQSKWRHIEIFHLASGEFFEVTAKINPDKHHYNPFVSAGADKVGYHRCRDILPHGPMIDGNVSPSCIPRLEAMESPVAGLGLLRIDGFFPSVSPCGRFIAYNKSLSPTASFSLFVMRSDGSKTWCVSTENVFYNVWDPCREGVVYCNAGSIFQPSSAGVHVVAIHFSLDALTDNVDEITSKTQLLTKPGTGNNAFPAPSPDGKQLVFRSGRAGGHGKNLYIMDAIHGEERGIHRLTCGEWTDTMPNWSPDGKWIAFSSTMDGVDESSFGLYMIRPDGKGLHRVSLGELKEDIEPRVHGRINHVEFSPDGHSIVFTADAAGVSAEPISLPNQFQPYGEIFISNPDGSNLVRLTHNAYEDGTPTWTRANITLPKHQLGVGGPVIIASAGAEPLRGDFAEPIWLDRVTEEMQSACC